MEVAHGGDVSTLRAINRPLPAPDVTFYLRISPTAAARRKEKFTGYETGFAPARTAAAFECFQVLAAREMDALAGEFGWIALPGEEPAAQITERLVAELTERLP